MIIESTKDGATCELFASFRVNGNTRSERLKLSFAWGRFLTVSPDGKYLFFMIREGIDRVSEKLLRS